MDKEVKRIIEAILFASSEPLSLSRIQSILRQLYDVSTKTLRQHMHELKDEYELDHRAFQLDEIAEGYVLRTREEFSPFIQQLGRDKRQEKLSQASTEVLAIIAYRQPITRAQVEAIRGVDSSGTINSLLERQLIEPVGKLETLGRPTLYGTTKDFLKHFGLRDTQSLPKFSS